ncbi:hypothetical protein MKEN_00258200 [Mycena kentingensis (nom. inval.)]|nr:hypothetical protein MKEN_00258200 [Mycena kentingensis (nom. inval.)]
MPRLPPELVGIVVDHISDCKTLTSCSLAARVFRFSAQRRLLTALALDDGANETTVPGSDLEWGPKARTYAEAAQRFSESPHLAGYVLELSIVPPTTEESVVAARQIFAALTRVRIARISGAPLMSMTWREWDELPASSAAAVLDWLGTYTGGSGRRLSYLTLKGWGLPLQVMHRALRAPSELLSFWDSRFQHADTAEDAHDESTPTCGPKSIDTFRSPGLFALLVQPQFRQYAANLQHLHVNLGTPSNDPDLATFSHLLAVSVDTLQSLIISFYGTEVVENVSIPLPRTFPKLKQLNIYVYNQHITGPLPQSWVVANLLRDMLLPAATPVLAQVAFKIRWESVDGRVATAPVCPCFAELLDGRLAAHPCIRKVGWRDMVDDFIDIVAQDAERHCTEFEALLKEALPRTVEKGLLEISRNSNWK